MTAQQTALQNLQELQAELPTLETEYKVAKDTFSSLQCEGKEGSYEWVKALENLERAEVNITRNKEYTKMWETDLRNELNS